MMEMNITLGDLLKIAIPLIVLIAGYVRLRANVNNHTNNNDVHRNLENLQDEFMPRETIETEFKYIRESLQRIESELKKRNNIK